MKNKLMLSVVAVVALTLNVKAGSKLLDYVPAGIDGVVSINIKQIIDVPIFKEKRTTDPEMKQKWAEFESELKKYGLTVNDLPSRAMVFFSKSTDINGAVIKTTLSEKKFADILKQEQTKRPGLYTTRKLNGNTVYVFSKKMMEKNHFPGGSKNIPALTFIKPDIAIVCDDKLLDKIVNSTKNNSTTVNTLEKKSSNVNRNALVWLVFKNSTPPVAPQPGQRPDMMSEITGMGLSLDLTGAQKRDLGLAAMISCRNNKAAASLGMQLQGLIMMGSAMAFKDNPQLGGELGQAVKIKPAGSNVSIKISVPEALGNKLQKYMAEKKTQQLQRRKTRNISK